MDALAKQSGRGDLQEHMSVAMHFPTSSARPAHCYFYPSRQRGNKEVVKWHGVVKDKRNIKERLHTHKKKSCNCEGSK